MKSKRPSGSRNLATIGWREWILLPDLGIGALQAKIDSGARTSALHASSLHYVESEGRPFVHFCVHSSRKPDSVDYHCRAEVLEFRRIRSSNGSVEERPVIATSLILLGHQWPIELTLTNRELMGFRMLLGRQAIRNRFMIDSGRSFYSPRLTIGPGSRGRDTAGPSLTPAEGAFPPANQPRLDTEL